MNIESQLVKPSRARRPHALIESNLAGYGNSETCRSLKWNDEVHKAAGSHSHGTSRPALAERNDFASISNQAKRLKSSRDLFCDSELSSDDVSSDPTTPGDVAFDKAYTLPASPPAIQDHPALSPSRRSYSGSITCHQMDVEGSGPFDGFSNQDALVWNNNRPFTGFSNEFLDGDSHVDDLFYPARPTKESVIAPLTPKHTPFDSGSLATVPLSTALPHDSELSPFDQMRRNIAALEGGDAVFSVQLDVVMDKLVYALTDLDSAYLFRDFAGHFTEFLDRFGPGGYDSHRAPESAGWIINLLLPLLHAEADASEARVRVYAEVSCWLQRVIKYLGFQNADLLLDSGPWDRCAEHMSSAHTGIALVAFETAEVIMRNVPLEYNLVLKVLFMQRPLETDLGDASLSYFRLCRVRLLSVLLERIDQEFRATNDEQNRRLVPEILRVLDKFKAEETDLRVAKSIDICIKYARDTEALFSRMSPSPLSPGTRRPHLSLTLPRWQQLQLAEPEEPEPERKPRFLSLKWFRQHSNKKDRKSVDTEFPDMKDSASINTLKSTKSVRQKWQKLLSPLARSSPPVNEEHEDAETQVRI